MAAAKLIRQAAFEHHINKCMVASLSERVVGVVAVAHFSVAKEVGISELNAVVAFPTTFVIQIV